ncbi:hypothetical protein MTR64_14460 [Novosphingobium sp. 2580]|uniref:Uncharacterized protein n=1 Tax=Novosphingobium album (ex Hu et al. 2023) TaxID=2930093 RepID=A0ABT0B463_9SPHN|nr:hypothetical protein [Novosphingobium album (ex Hu et al. 2023)]MCJ2179773.1 hypothetical protein [Novosphingobium album (ex Hu et al. 2023)]
MSRRIVLGARPFSVRIGSRFGTAPDKAKEIVTRTTIISQKRHCRMAAPRV